MKPKSRLGKRIYAAVYVVSVVALFFAVRFAYRAYRTDQLGEKYYIKPNTRVNVLPYVWAAKKYGTDNPIDEYKESLFIGEVPRSLLGVLPKGVSGVDAASWVYQPAADIESKEGYLLVLYGNHLAESDASLGSYSLRFFSADDVMKFAKLPDCPPGSAPLFDQESSVRLASGAFGSPPPAGRVLFELTYFTGPHQGKAFYILPASAAGIEAGRIERKDILLGSARYVIHEAF